LPRFAEEKQFFMELLQTDLPLHDLARDGSASAWGRLVALASADGEGKFAVGYHLNKRDDQRYTPLHTAIFAR
jgi:hypothetical protein